MTKFSVIVPIYNVGKYLKECIESVLNQSFSNFELILVNDGSPDNSEDICSLYIDDPRVKYIKKINEGVAIARNMGIANSTGDYIFCLDGDDKIEPKFLEKLAINVENYHSDFIVIGEYFCKNPPQLIGALPTCAFSVSRAFLNNFPEVRFIERMQPCEDGLFSHKLLILAKKISFCPDAEYIYRRHDASSEASLNGTKIINEIPKWFEILENFYEEYNLWNVCIDELLAFINNEPYQLRFLKMKLNIKERIIIFNTVQKFCKKHSIKCDNIYFGNDFQAFINSANFFLYWVKHVIYKFMPRIKF